MFTLYNHAKIAPLPNFNNSQGNFRFWPKTIILVLKKVPDNWFFPKSTYKMIFMSDTLVTKPYWLVNLYVDQTISNLDYYLFVCFKLNLVLGHWGYYLHSFFFFKLFIFCPSHSLFLKRKKDTRKAGRRHSYSYHLRLGSVKENKNIKLNYEGKKQCAVWGVIRHTSLQTPGMVSASRYSTWSCLLKGRDTMPFPRSLKKKNNDQ